MCHLQKCLSILFVVEEYISNIYALYSDFLLTAKYLPCHAL